MTIDIELVVKVTQSDNQYPLHNVTPESVKFKVAICARLTVQQEMHSQENTLLIFDFDHWVNMTQYEAQYPLCTCKGWCCLVQLLKRRYNYRKRDGRTDARPHGHTLIPNEYIPFILRKASM